MSIDDKKPKKKKRISVAAAKSKGRRLQKKVASTISELLNIPCGKDELIESREMGQTGCDVKLIGEARRLFPYSIECKAQENWGVFSWLRQAQTNTMPHTDWMLICSRNNFPPVVLLDNKVFNDILKCAYESPDWPQDNLIFERHAQYDLKAWRLPEWIQAARYESRNLKTNWFIHCKKSEEFDVVTVDFDQLFDFFKRIPSLVKR